MRAAQASTATVARAGMVIAAAVAVKATLAARLLVLKLGWYLSTDTAMVTATSTNTCRMKQASRMLYNPSMSSSC